MNPWLILPSLPTLVQSGILLIFVAPIFCRYKAARAEGGILWLQWRPWFAKRWKYTTTLGFIAGTHDPWSLSNTLIKHERIHTFQYQDANLLGLFIGGIACIGDWRWGLGIWASSGMLWLVPNFLTGWIRYGDPYYGSEHERSAYAQTRPQ